LIIIHVSVGIIFFLPIFYCVNIPQSVYHSTVDGYLGCSELGLL
jgi:hypothetical protein